MSEVARAMRTQLANATAARVGTHAARHGVAEAARYAELLVDVSDLYLQLALPIRIIRPDDLVVLECRLINLVRRGAAWQRVRGNDPAFIVAVHQGQAFGEQAYLRIQGDTQEEYAADDTLKEPPSKNANTANENPPASQPVPIALAGPSRVVFRMPDAERTLACSTMSLLDAMRRWPLRLAAGARADADEVSRRPTYAPADLALYADSLLTALAGRHSATALRRLDKAARDVATATLRALQGGTAVQARSLLATLDAALDAAMPAPRIGTRTPSRTPSRTPTRTPVDEGVDRLATAMYLEVQATMSLAGMLESAAAADQWDLTIIPPEVFWLWRPTPVKPSPNVTALELPYRLMSSPLPGAGFTHAVDAVERNGRTELWHSRLGTRVETGDAVHVDDKRGRLTRAGWDGEKLRFLWSPDYPNPTETNDHIDNQSLDRFDRRMLVKLTAGFNEKLPNGDYIEPRAAHVERLMLTALGGDLEASRQWTRTMRPAGVDLSAWTHRAAIGRDYFVRVEYSGYLYPFGHRATLIKITWRNFEWRGIGANRRRIALLRQRFFIVVRDRVIAYPATNPMPFGGRGFPFREVHCLVDITPDLDRPGQSPNDRLPSAFYALGTADEVPHRMAFWPSLGGGKDYRFAFLGIDGAGRRVAFDMPVLFVSEVVNTRRHLAGQNGVIGIRGYYNAPARAARRTAPLARQVVRLAAPTAAATDVDYPLAAFMVDAHEPTSGITIAQGESLQQFPGLATADAALTSLEQVTSTPRVSTVAYDATYLTSGLSPANGELFARMVAPTALSFGSGVPTDAVGGIATPSLTPSGLSARHGVASAAPSGNPNMDPLAQFASGQFDPAEFFPDARLLGFFSIKDVLTKVALSATDEIPRITSVEQPGGIATRFAISQVIPAGSPLPGLITGAGGASTLSLDTEIFAPSDGSPPSKSVEGRFTNFKIDLVGCLILRFDRLRFLQVDGRKPDVDVDLHPTHGVTFGGPLEFVNRLKDFIPMNGFSDPPNLAVTPAGLTASYSLGLPAIQVGVLSMTNIRLGAAFTLPFTGEAPTARFNFAERHDTFNLTVSLFGGGGFLAIVVAADGVREIEAALEFGARISIDLGVASGSVYVKGGFYFCYSDEMVVFEGYVELGGRLSVLGLITVSLTFHLSLAYESISNGNKPDGSPRSTSRLFGQATLVVEVDVLLFSASVSVRVQRTFAGSEADPTFRDFLPTPQLWADYCDAFA